MTTTLTNLLKTYRDNATGNKELAGKATPGPWNTTGLGYHVESDDSVICECDEIEGEENGAFIAASRTLVPNQADTILRLCEMLEKACEQRNEAYDFYLSDTLEDQIYHADKKLLEVAASNSAAR